MSKRKMRLPSKQELRRRLDGVIDNPYIAEKLHSRIIDRLTANKNNLTAPVIHEHIVAAIEDYNLDSRLSRMSRGEKELWLELYLKALLTGTYNQPILEEASQIPTQGCSRQ
jgi:hypothetical protein